MSWNVQATEYGYTTRWIGLISVEETKPWFEEIKAAIKGKNPFGQVIDLRGQTAQSAQTSAVVQDAMGYLLAHGLERSAVVVSSLVMRMQVMRLAKSSGMYEYERYFAVDASEEWPPSVLAWVVDGVDPDVGEPGQD